MIQSLIMATITVGFVVASIGVAVVVSFIAMHTITRISAP